MTSSSDGLALEIDGWLAEQVAALDLDRQKGPGKPRVLPALLLWTGLVVCVLRGMSSQAALWRLLSQRGLWSFPRIPISDDAVRARLARDGTEPLERLFTQVTTLLAQRIAPFVETTLAAFATDILVLDEITLDKVARVLPALRALPAGDPGLLAGTLAALFDVRRQQWRRILYREDTFQNEKVAARSLLDGLAQGTLLLCDLGYFGFKWFDDLTDGGFFWLSRLRSRTSYDPITILYQQGEILDAIVWLGKYRADRAKHAVRLIQFPVNGRVYRYITNVLDPAQLSMREAAQLYARRWDIEMAISIVKTELRLHLIWAAKPVVIQQQIWAVLIIHQIFAAFRIEIAGRAEVDLFDVSLPLLIEYFPHYARTGTDPIALFVECGRELGFIRPSSRHEIQAPVIPLHHYHALPPELILERTPRYAERRCERKAS
jgi:Transposase DDE domain